MKPRTAGRSRCPEDRNFSKLPTICCGRYVARGVDMRFFLRDHYDPFWDAGKKKRRFFFATSSSSKYSTEDGAAGVQIVRT